MDKIMIVIDNEEARDGRVDLIRREFNTSLLDAERIEKEGYALADAVFKALGDGEDRMRAANEPYLLQIMVHAMRIVAVSTHMCAEIVDQAIPCECPSCREARGRLN